MFHFLRLATKYLGRFTANGLNPLRPSNKCFIIQLLSFTCISCHKCSENSENLKNLLRPARAHTATHLAKPQFSISLREVFVYVNCLPKTDETCSVYRHTIAKILSNDKTIELSLQLHNYSNEINNDRV